MNPTLLRIVAVLSALSFFQLACYNSYRISNDELQNLTSRHIASSVELETSEGPVEVRATTPIQLVTTAGEKFTISPFNFTFDENGLVAPDYDLLLMPDEVDGAQVFEFAKGRTTGLIIGSILAAGGAFAAVSLLAGSSSAGE